MMRRAGEVDGGGGFEDRVVETVKWCEQRKESPLVWGIELSKCVEEAGLKLPSAELGEVLVSNLCFRNNTPSLWKFIHQAISSGLLSSLQLLALLTSRIIPHRQTQPEAYRLYLELLSQYAFCSTTMGDTCRKKVTKSVNDALQLSRTYGIHMVEYGHALVLFFFSVVIGLIDCTLHDLGLQHASIDVLGSVFGDGGLQDMDIDSKESYNDKVKEHRENLRRSNILKATEVLGKLIDNRKSLFLLQLIRLNMPEKWGGLLQRLHLLEANKLASLNVNLDGPNLAKLLGNIQKTSVFESHLKKRNIVGALIDIGSCSSTSSCNFKTGLTACWASFDIYLETLMEGKQLPSTSAFDILAELIKTLKVINRASWQQTLLALWISALQVVQRERDPLEGPIPHLDSRLCILLCITPLAIVQVMKNEGKVSSSSLWVLSDTAISNEHRLGPTFVKHGLVSSLQALLQFHSLLSPPASVVNAANNAAAKAMSFISSFKNGINSISGCGHSDTYSKADGNMLHLIVEACIARKLIDTSAYFWPGYVVAPVPSSDSSTGQGSPWSAFMEGARLVGPLKESLIATPAPSLVEIEKLYHIALNGSEEERSAAAKILCGSSLSRGWNIQEHVLNYVVKLLSPPLPCNSTGHRSHLVDHMSMLNAILLGMSSVDIVHIISLHGMVPEVAASIMPLCEVFGSLVPTSGHKSSMGDDVAVYQVFSCAFLFLLRLWKFYRPPHEHCITEGGRYSGPELTLEYLLILHNSRVALHNSAAAENDSNRTASSVDKSTSQAVYIDSFPKLRAWYCQNKACIASTVSGVSSANPVHQVANRLLNMICWKITKGAATTSSSHSTISSSSISGSPGSTGEDARERPMLPAWEVLEAAPYVLEALLTACAHGKLSSKDLTTGLRDLVDFLPASLAAVVSYFSAEVTRGIWKPVPMNGIDWPNPAAYLQSVESEIREILSAAGVTISSLTSGTAPFMLPLPVAALVGLTITFKLDKSLEYVHAIAGSALASCASDLPWPTMPVIGALWAQKIRRWHDFIVVSSSFAPFKQSQDAVIQLLRSCFASFLGSHPAVSPTTTMVGINGLLGSTISAHGCRSTIAPGFLYLRSCRTLQNIHFMNDVIVKFVAESARESAVLWTKSNSCRLKSSWASLASATTRAKEVAILGSSLLCVAGGFQLLHLLYQETIPTWLLSTREKNVQDVGGSGPMSCILEGYAMAFLLILSGSFMWGVGERSSYRSFSKRAAVVGVHLDFVAGALERNISLGCDPATWKAYVSCFVGLMVSFVPAWIKDVNKETLEKLANGLRGWHECELAISLLERGGIAAMGHVAELIHEIG